MKDPTVRKQYENDLSIIINAALAKYCKEKSVVKIAIIAKIGKGGQASVFLVEVQEADALQCIIKQNYAMKRVSKQKLDIGRTKQALLL